MSDREWRDVKDFEDVYSVSSHGEIFSKRRKKIMRLTKDADGYLKISLHHRKNKKRKTLTVHRIVAMAFLRKINGKDEVNHINGNKLDNRVQNLEWCTRSHNMKHAHDSDLLNIANGERCHFTKLNAEAVREIRILRQEGIRARIIGEKYGIGTSQVYRIAKRMSQKQVE